MRDASEVRAPTVTVTGTRLGRPVAAGTSGTSTCSCVGVALTTRPSRLPSKRTRLLEGVGEKFFPVTVNISPTRAREGAMESMDGAPMPRTRRKPAMATRTSTPAPMAA